MEKMTLYLGHELNISQTIFKRGDSQNGQNPRGNMTIEQKIRIMPLLAAI